MLQTPGLRSPGDKKPTSTQSQFPKLYTVLQHHAGTQQFPLGEFYVCSPQTEKILLLL